MKRDVNFVLFSLSPSPIFSFNLVDFDTALLIDYASVKWLEEKGKYLFRAYCSYRRGEN